MSLGLAMVALSVLAALGVVGGVAYAVARRGRVDRARRAPAIVVLGARVFPDGRPSAALCARVEKAAALYRAGLAPWVVATGGGGEAEVMLRLLERAGVPPSACTAERESRNTYENARNTAPLLRARGVAEVVLVTDSLHMLRAERQFLRAGILALPSPAPLDGRGLSVVQWLGYLLREALGVLRAPALWRPAPPARQ